MTDIFNSPGAAEAAAERELGSLLSGVTEVVPDGVVTETAPAEAAPAATPEAAPAGTNVQVAAPVTPPAPEGIKPEGTSTSLPEDPAVKKALGIYGDDPVAAAKGFLETNTRNAQMAAVLKQLGYDTKTLQPLPQEARPQVEQPPQAPVDLDETTINASISQLLNNDPNYSQLVTAYEANYTRLGQIGGESKALDDKIARANFALSIPEIKADTFKVDEYARELAQARSEKLQLSLEASILEGKQERLNGHARARSEAARTAVVQHYTQQANTQREEVQLATAQLEARAELATSWPLAVDRAIKDHNIPQDLVEDFKEETKLAGRAFLAQENSGPISDVYGFVGARAKTLMDRYDRYHRSKSAEYGQQAATRTAAVTASTPALAPTETRAPRQIPSLMQAQLDLEKDADLAWKQMFG